MGQWLAEAIDITSNEADFVSNPTLYTYYKDWCDENGATPKKISGLTQALKSKGLAAGERARVGGKLVRGCFGVKVKP